MPHSDSKLFLQGTPVLQPKFSGHCGAIYIVQHFLLQINPQTKYWAEIFSYPRRAQPSHPAVCFLRAR